jgi:hypothetical protein
MIHRLFRNEDGASAIIVAASLLLLIGMAAVAVDLGAGFNTRRQDQTAADLAATTAAIEAANQTIAVTEALDIARKNLDATFTDTEWQTLWETCTDPDRPVGFYPVPNVFPTPGTTNLNCISINPAGDMGLEFRVRIPDQFTATSFGAGVGLGSLTTSAVAHSQLVFSRKGDVLPFGLLNNAQTGQEQCILQPAGGLATGACTGSTSGNFGTVQLPGWGNTEKGTSIQCNRSDTDLITQNIAIGQDHIVLPATGSNGQVSSFPGTGGPHPDDGGPAFPNGLAKQDACTSASGNSEPVDLNPVSPLNTLDTTTGNNAAPLQSGLFGDPDGGPVLPGGELPRLRSTSGDTLFLRERNGSDEIQYEVDNTALWSYLRTPGSLIGIPGVGTLCKKTDFEDALVSYADKRTQLVDCLASYEVYLNGLADPSTAEPLFTDAIADNPRFGWAPRFHYTTWGSGTTWQPIHSFEVLYIDGVWFNCNGSGSGPNTEPCSGAKGVKFYPQEYPNATILKSGSGPYGGDLRLDQMTALVLPIESMPQSVVDEYPGTKRGPFRVQIVR